MITDIEDYFTKGCGRCDHFTTPDCATRSWAGGLTDLRRICRDVGLVETVKSGHRRPLPVAYIGKLRLHAPSVDETARAAGYTPLGQSPARPESIRWMASR